MSHALDFTAGKAAIAYRGAKPWHGFGEQITDNMSADEMRKAAALDWHVEELDSFYPFNGTMLKVPNRKALVRSDTGAWLSQMSETKYEVRQPAAIVDFFRDICDVGGFRIETLGALNEGRRVWCMAERVGGCEELSGLIKPKILLADSYDGTMATVAKFTTVTVVCANTLAMARADGVKEEVKIGHHTKFDADKVKAQLGAIDSTFGEFLDMMKKFSEVKMSQEFKERFFLKLFGNVKPDAKKENKHFFGESEGAGKAWKRAKIDYDVLTTNSRNTVADLMKLSEPGFSPGADFFPDTAWNALQTVTYYIDHATRTKNNLRWQSALLGTGNNTKDEALDLAMSLVG